MTLWWGLGLAAAAAAFVAWPLLVPPGRNDGPEDVPDAAAELARELAWDADAGRLDEADLPAAAHRPEARPAPAAGAPPGGRAEQR